MPRIFKDRKGGKEPNNTSLVRFLLWGNNGHPTLILEMSYDKPWTRVIFMATLNKWDIDQSPERSQRQKQEQPQDPADQHTHH